MRKRNFIKSFLYYSAIIAIPILTVFLVFLAFVFQGKQNEIREDAETAAQAVRDNYSLVLDSAATQYDILARNPRLSISLRGFISHKQIGYLDVILTNTILSNFNSLTNNAPYIASVYYYLDGYDSILTSDTGGTTRLSQFSDLSWKDSYDHSDQDEWLERREMHQYSYTQPVPVLTYFKKLSMFKGVVMVNIYEEQLKQLINTSSQLDRFFILDRGGIIRDIQLSEENLKKCRYERLSEIFPRIMFYSYATVKTTKETGGFNMNQQTNENNSTSCSYQELNPEMDAFLQGYLEEGRRKGLQESTIHLHDKIGHYFLFAMTETGCLKPQEMNAQNVGIACLKISSRWYLSHIRTFLRYAYQSGNTDRDYSGIVPLFKIPQPYPSVYTAEEIQKIENSVDQSSPHGKRDYAALLLATRLGIRSGDISSMTLECLDFERNLIRLTQHKTGVFIEFPMVSDVKVALERYLQEERTAYDSPYVFLRIVPPYGHISVQAIAKIARTAIAVAGIEPGGRKQGAHAFRSSLASSMINDNIPYEAVRKILGHTDQNAIRSYARLDMEQLRGYALPVMEATGIFAEFLEGRWSLS
ncbi:tyrosine-type recombinase/integrase [Enterocloster clostridioformis]|nr:tyrosine-type recombinase/integrase [Enterocloster clostridioformis]SFG08199.1 Site-specific recombinase XerD [Enterocloster clostridioformis]